MKNKEIKTIKKAKFETYFTEKTHLHVSSGNKKTGKGIYIINLLPGDEPLCTSNGTLLSNIHGTCNGCCNECKHECYAIRYTLRYNNTCIPPYADNTLLARHDIDTFFKELQRFINMNIVSVIRYHAAGEIPSYEYLCRMVKIAEINPRIIFYTYTKRYSWLEKYIEVNGDFPSNLIINVSIWHKNYSNPWRFPEFIYDDGTDDSLKEIIHCPAVDRNGHDTGVTCSYCKRCFNTRREDKIAVYSH